MPSFFVRLTRLLRTKDDSCRKTARFQSSSFNSNCHQLAFFFQVFRPSLLQNVQDSVERINLSKTLATRTISYRLESFVSKGRLKSVKVTLWNDDTSQIVVLMFKCFFVPLSKWDTRADTIFRNHNLYNKLWHFNFWPNSCCVCVCVCLPKYYYVKQKIMLFNFWFVYKQPKRRKILIFLFA